MVIKSPKQGCGNPCLWKLCGGSREQWCCLFCLVLVLTGLNIQGLTGLEILLVFWFHQDNQTHYHHKLAQSSRDHRSLRSPDDQQSCWSSFFVMPKSKPKLKAKLGRPLQSPEPRCTNVVFRLNPTEYKALETAAWRYDVSTSQIIREALMVLGVIPDNPGPQHDLKNC